MNRFRTFFRQLLCSHQARYHIRNLYGDEIIVNGFKRSIWQCSDCGKVLYGEEER